jgi:uncharacterized membrane protein YesL
MKTTSTSLNIITQALRNWWDEWVTLAIINIIGIVCWTSIVLGPPATFGIYFVTNRLVQGESVGIRGFVEGGKRYFFISWLWMLVNVLAATIVVANYLFYSAMDVRWANFLKALFIILGLLWLVVQFYMLPYMMEQERKHLGIAFRNGLFTMLAAPGYTFVIVGLGAIILVVSTGMIFPLILGVPPLIAVIGNQAVVERLITYRVRERENTDDQQDEP